MSCPCSHAGSHDDDCELPSLLPSIDLPRVRCLNAAAAPAGAAARVLRPLADRRERAAAACLRSNAGDSELLLHIPFNSAVQVRALCFGGLRDGSAPARASLWVNREELDFAAAADVPPVQELELVEDESSDAWYPLRATRFSGVTSLALLLSGTHGGGDESAVYFVGLKGVASGHTRQTVDAVYETRPQLADHAARADAGGGRLGI